MWDFQRESIHRKPELYCYVTDETISNLGTIKEADLEAVMACEPDVIFIGGRLSKSYDALSDPISTPMIEQRPSLPRTLKPPLVHRPTMAFLPSANAFSVSIRLSNPPISAAT